MSVGDIYGGDYSGINLAGDMIASSFAKIKDLPQDEIKQLKKEVSDAESFFSENKRKKLHQKEYCS